MPIVVFAVGAKPVLNVEIVEMKFAQAKLVMTIESLIDFGLGY